MTVSVIIADDHELTVTGIRLAIDAMPGFQVVAETGDGLEAIALCKQHRPDIAVLDMAMPGASGLEAFAEIRRWAPDTRVVILTGSTAQGLFTTLDQAAVDGIFVKNGPVDEICSGLRRIARGERVVSARASALIEETIPGQALSNRELQVLQGIANGLTNAGIAERLSISPKTVDNHRTSLMRKLGVRSSTALVVRAVRDGLVQI